MNLYVVILAAGLGKRMNSFTPKVLHKILGRPMLRYVIDAVKPLKPKKTVVVVGNGADVVRERVNDRSVAFVIQKRFLGTGNALTIAQRALKGIGKGTTLVLNGDSPLITTKTLKGLLTKQKRNKNMLSFLSFIDDSLSGYGRIMRDKNSRVVGIVEDKHATSNEKMIFKELNGGVYAIESEILKHLDKIKKNTFSGEYYLTDLIGIISKTGKKLDAYSCSSDEIRGVNTREELHKVSEILQKRIISKWMKNGVTFIDPDTSIVHPAAAIGKDTVLYPNTYLEGRTLIGKKCVIYPGVRIYESTLGDDVVIKDNTLIEESRIKKEAVIGPFAHIRPNSIVGCRAKIGNFVELKKAAIGDGSKVMHLTYIGDADVGKDVNIGAGTITCNYDGQKKHKTKIGDGVFIGSDSQLVAPVTIGKGAYVAAAATITKDVPANALVLGRVKQRIFKDWAIRKKLKVRSKK